MDIGGGGGGVSADPFEGSSLVIRESVDRFIRRDSGEPPSNQLARRRQRDQADVEFPEMLEGSFAEGSFRSRGSPRIIGPQLPEELLD